jgi:hypothetical protein
MTRINRSVLSAGFLALASWVGFAATGHAQVNQPTPTKLPITPTVKPVVVAPVVTPRPHPIPTTTPTTVKPVVIQTNKPTGTTTVTNPTIRTNPVGTPLLNPYYGILPGASPVLSPFASLGTQMPTTASMMNPFTNPYYYLPNPYVLGYTVNPNTTAFSNPFGVVPVIVPSNPILMPNTWNAFSLPLQNTYMQGFAPLISPLGFPVGLGY